MDRGGMGPAELQQEMLEMLRAAWCPLPDKPHETPEGTLGLLACSAGPPDRPDWSARLRELVRRRIAGEPLAYLVGSEAFMGILLETAPGAMIPRRETEILGRAALGCMEAMSQDRLRVFDICTGAGGLALALASAEPRCRVWGGDLSPDAIRLARRNSCRLGLDGRVQFLVGDFLEPFRALPEFGSADLLVCNPPYISSARVEGMAREIAGFEPREAFDGGPFGVSFLLRIGQECHQAVRPGGWVACEVGQGQGESLCEVFRRKDHFERVERVLGPDGNVRAILARTHP